MKTAPKAIQGVYNIISPLLLYGNKIHCPACFSKRHLTFSKHLEAALEFKCDSCGALVHVSSITRPAIVCLCGSTRFSEAFREANLRETLAARIVLTIGCDMKSDHELFEGKSEAELAEIKLNLDFLHRRKIDLADEVLVLNVGGYIGESTRSEIDYAYRMGKRVRYLEEPTA